mgnify:CR=1 FL=1
MKLKTLLEDLEILEVKGNLDIEKEIEKLDILEKKEIDVYSQSIPENSKISLENMKKKI